MNTRAIPNVVNQPEPLGWIDELDLDLAWKRLKADRPDRCFVVHPHHIAWVESDLPAWFEKVRSELRSGYQPRDCATCYAPKGNWMVRPGAYLELEDELVFNALVGAFHSQIWEAIGWSQGRPDIAYQFQRNSQQTKWVKRDFSIWNEWRTKSLEQLSGGIQFVLFTDISAFYENIDLAQIGYDLKSIGVTVPHLEVLTSCLRRWSGTGRKGIPQGYSASDILAKLYLNVVDRTLQTAGFNHLRYVDDIRIFCKSRLEAKRALLTLNDLLRHRSLNLQSAKTEILNAENARHKIDGVAPVIESIQAQLSADIKGSYIAGPYDSLEDIEPIIEQDADSPALEVLERAFQEHVAPTSSASSEDFDKTLFHYVLNRLGKVQSRAAVDYCLGLLASRPEETEHVLRYLGAVGLTGDDETAILRYTDSSDAIYDYQLYQIVQWFLSRSAFPAKLVDLSRRWAHDQNRESWLRAYSLAVLGAAGDAADLELLESKYQAARSDMERAEIVAALARMETSRRNAFYGRVKNDRELVRRVVITVRARSEGRSTT